MGSDLRFSHRRGGASAVKRSLVRLGISALALLAASLANATDHYVDGSAAPSGDGAGWATAWKAFSAINWANVHPGDTIHVSGGTAGQSYRGPLEPKVSGAIGSPIVIARAKTPGHDGPVLVDGRHVVPACVVINNRSNVEVYGIDVKSCGEAGVKIHASRNIIYQGGRVQAQSRGFHVWRSQSVLLSKNVVTTPTWTYLETDGIYSQENESNKYIKNVINISNGEPAGHDDGIQSNHDSNTLYDGNYIEQRNSKEVNAQGIFIVDALGRTTAINNVVYGPNTNNGMIKFLNLSGTNGKIDIFNNTLVGGKWGTILIQDAPDSRIYNNILYSTAANGSGIALVPGSLPPAANIDFNFYYVPNGKPGYIVGYSTYGWSRWKARGYEKNGVVRSLIAPGSLFDKQFTPLAGSPVIDAGATLGLVRRDRIGRPRPRGAHYDIGAYEGPRP